MRIALAAIPLVFALTGLLDWWLGIPVVISTVELAREHGPSVALASLAGGLAGLLLWARLMERRLRRRDLSA